MSDELDERKIRLDEQRHQFEIQKYDDDREQRAATLAKTQADIDAIKHPFRVPASWSPIAAVFVAIVGGAIAFGTDVFKSNVTKLAQQNTQLHGENVQLSAQQTQLKSQNDSLAQSNQNLINDRNGLKVQIGTAKQQIAGLEDQRKGLAEQVRGEHLQAILGVLRDDSASVIGPDDQAYIQLLQIAKSHQNDAEFTPLIRKSFEDPHGQAKVALAALLYEAHADAKLKSFIFDSTLREINAMCTYTEPTPESIRSLGKLMGWLHDDSIFNLQDRAKSLEDAYGFCLHPPFPFKAPPDDLTLFFVRWDTDATALYKVPWLDAWTLVQKDHAGYARLSMEREAISDVVEIAKGEGDSGATVRVADALIKACSHIDSPLCDDVGYHGSHIPFAPPNQAQADVNRAMTLVHISPEKVVTYRAWVQAHPKLVALFSQQSPDRFKTLPNGLFGAVVRDAWLKEDQLPN